MTYALALPTIIKPLERRTIRLERLGADQSCDGMRRAFPGMVAGHFKGDWACAQIGLQRLYHRSAILGVGPIGQLRLLANQGSSEFHLSSFSRLAKAGGGLETTPRSHVTQHGYSAIAADCSVYLVEPGTGPLHSLQVRIAEASVIDDEHTAHVVACLGDELERRARGGARDRLL